MMDNNLDLQYDRLLGEGSYGKVFLVKQDDGQQFAVKEIDLTKCDENGREQAHGESHLLSRLKHKNILRYVESVICDECLYIITEYCEGGDLEDYLQVVSKRGLHVPESLVSEWIFQIGGALKYLHDQKILHRDMKTKNIFLKEDLSTKLGDLGIAKVLDLNQSKADTFIGTPSYMSPELFSGKSYNHKTDIWGLGCCAYEMMTMQRAFQGKALWTLIREIKNGRPLDLPDMYSLEIRTLVQEMMSQKPEDRPSAKDIVQNDYLCYHKGSAHEEVLKTLPRPHENVEKKQKSRNSRAIGGSGSGSLGKALLQMSQAQEDLYKSTVESICEKITTLRLTQRSNGGIEPYDTFVYKGDDDSGTDEELEAQGTVLDKSLLKQYTEQLDTFVFKGEGIVDSDSDYSSGSLVKKSVKSSGDELDDDEEEDVNRTLLRQYSKTLEEEELQGDEGQEEGGRSFEPEDSGIDQSDSLETAGDKFEETAVMPSKYQYKGLKDTFALRPDKKWHHGDVRQLFSPNAGNSDKSSRKGVQRSESDTTRKSPIKSNSFSLSSSFSSTGSVSGSRTKVSDPRLHKTLSGDDKSDSKNKTAKLRTCDRIEQSARSSSGEKKSPKKAFMESEEVISEYNIEGANINVKDMISHFKDNISPYTSVDSQSETIRSQRSETIRSQGSDDLSSSQERSPDKGKKKKANYLKKQSEAKKRAPDTPGNNTKENGSANDVRLFTRAQSAKFTKGDDSDDENCLKTSKNGKHSIEDILRCVQKGCSENVRNEKILAVQQELVAGVGYDNLRRVVDIMDMVNDEQEREMHIVHILGPKLYEEYKHHLKVITLLEGHSQVKAAT